jgi:ABC-type transport system involved in Fe-S cluster assembly fused permease/ATPase subunit
MVLLTFILNRFNLYIKGHVIECLIYNLKEYVLRYIMTLSMDFYSNNSSREVLEVIVLGKQYIYFINSLILNLIPSVIDIITFVVYFLYFINVYIGLIIIDIIVIYIWIELIKNPKLF